MENNSDSEFVDSLSSNIFLAYILLLSRITRTTFIDSIFSNHVWNEVIVGNPTTIITNHLQWFLIGQDIFCNLQANETSIFERNCWAIDHGYFILDYFDIKAGSFETRHAKCWHIVMKLLILC